MKKKSAKAEKDRYVKVCPACKCADIHLDWSNPLQPAMGLPATYICKRCGHRGHIFPEVAASELKDFNKDIEKLNLRNSKEKDQSLVDTSYGNFQVRIIWKLTAPVIFLIGLLYIKKEPLYGLAMASAGLFMTYITYFRKRGLKEKE
ncbi:MAG: hypothetical protein U9O53_03235 [archaeon]|nr:hypothetical protein [archaeon]